MVWPVGDGAAVLLGDALAPVRPHTLAAATMSLASSRPRAWSPRWPSTARQYAHLTEALNGWHRRPLPTVATTRRLGAVIAARPVPGTGCPPPTAATAAAHTG
jgi:hypothetical protein